MNAFDLLIADEVCHFSTSPRDESINAAISDFVSLARAGENINNSELQDAVFYYNDLENLSMIEKDYIRRTVERKINGY